MPTTESSPPPYQRARLTGTEYDKFLFIEARSYRYGVRSAAVPSTDAALEATGQLLRGRSQAREKADLIRKVRSAEPTARELADGVERPNERARDLAETCVVDLFERSLNPVRVAASIVGGVFLAYRSGNGLCLDIEIDNDGDMLGVLSDDDGVIRSEPVDIPAKISRLVRDFRYPRPSVLRRAGAGER